jgi:DNA-binding FadR family transcriptional regulator
VHFPGSANLYWRISCRSIGKRDFHGRPPAEADIQQHFGGTPPTIHQMILTLERQGLIRSQPRAPRSIEVLVAHEHLPVLLAPGQPVKTSVPRN